MTTRARGPDVRAAIYTRISRDAEGLALGVERQREDIEKLCADSGLEIVARYEDNDVGASTRSHKPRPAYRQMLAGAAEHRFGVIVAYTSSRLTRRPRENEDLIELAERFGTRIIYKNSPSFDLNTADGRMVARQLAAFDAAESERISERVSRKVSQRAKAGEWHGGWAPCGYHFTYDRSDPPKVTAMKIDRPRAEILQEMAQRVIDGESLYALCRDLNDRKPFVSTPPGAKAKGGAMWRSRTLKRALINPALIGKREYAGQLYDGSWPAILDRETWDQVREVLLDPARTDPSRSWMQDTSRKRALSGLLKCGAHYDDGRQCGHTLVSQPYRGQASMICHSQSTGGCGHLRIAYEPVETWVARLLIARLDRPQMRRALKAERPDNRAEVKQLRRAVAADERALRNLEDERDDDPSMTTATYRRRRDRITARIEASRHVLAQIVGRSAVEVASGRDLADRLATASVEQQRSLFEHFIERIVIAPHPAGVTTTVTRRRDEPDDEYDARVKAHRELILSERVKIEWSR